jgi:hypothetical protein
MAMTTTIPIAIAPEAAARAAELGMESEFDAMVEHSKQAITGLQSLDVRLEIDPEGEDEVRVVLWARREDRNVGNDKSEWHWDEWMVQSFPPEVCRHFVLVMTYGAADGR